MREPLIFHWRQGQDERGRRFDLAVLGIALIAMLVGIWVLFPFPIEIFAKIDWSGFWKKVLHSPEGLVKGVLVPLIALLVLWAQVVHKKRARLTLDIDTLRYSSGVPVLGRWLDWTLDLETLRSNKLSLTVIGEAYGAQPLKCYRLAWGVGQLRQLRPTAWYLPDQPRVQPVRPKSFFGLIRWQTPENQSVLQEQFNQLPLVQALRQRGVELRPITGKRQIPGLDLMAYPRMKVAVISFFVGLFSAFALFHLTRHQHYFVQPPVATWIAFGTLVGFGMLGWLWFERPAEASLASAGGTIEFRYAQGLLAVLLAVAAGLCAPSLPLAFANVTQASQALFFVLQKSPLLLQAKNANEMPGIQPMQATEYWLSLPEGEAILLPVRRGIAGLWWQFDSSVLQDRIEAFYDSLPRR